MCLSTARNFFRCIRSSRSEPWLLKKSLSTLRSYRRREPPLCGSFQPSCRRPKAPGMRPCRHESRPPTLFSFNSQMVCWSFRRPRKEPTCFASSARYVPSPLPLLFAQGVQWCPPKRSHCRNETAVKLENRGDRML